MATSTSKITTLGLLILLLLLANPSSSIKLSRHSCYQCLKFHCPENNNTHLLLAVVNFSMAQLRDYIHTELLLPVPCPEEINDHSSWDTMALMTPPCPSTPSPYHLPTCAAGKFQVNTKIPGKDGEIICTGTILGCAKLELLQMGNDTLTTTKTLSFKNETINSYRHSLHMLRIVTCLNVDHCMKDDVVDNVDEALYKTSKLYMIVGIIAGVVLVALVLLIIGTCCVPKCRRSRKSNVNKKSRSSEESNPS